MVEKIETDNQITHDDFLAVSRRVHYNQAIADFYEQMASENEMPYLGAGGEIKYGKDIKFTDRAKSLRDCGKHWQFDFYPKQGYKNLVRVNRCKDRFCLNCQALEADQRFVQYAGVLDGYACENDVYHIVFTVPNVDAWRLADTVSLMLDRFQYLIRFFDGRKGIRYVSFRKYGYIGAVRSLEITVSKKNGSYHPHLHCMFILKKDMNMQQVYWNRFSEDYTGRNSLRLFTEFEMLLQRIWCLLILRLPVTKYNIEHIADFGYPDGFSVRADLSNGRYHEIFKYAIKGAFKEETLFKYEAFMTLYKALFGRRCYQTFGCLLHYDFNAIDENLGLASPDEMFDLFVARLQRLETPERVEEILDDILKMTKEDRKIKYISKATFSRHFRSLSDEDKQEALEKLREVN